MTASSVLQGSLALWHEGSLNLERLKGHDSHPYLKCAFLLVWKSRLRDFNISKLSELNCSRAFKVSVEQRCNVDTTASSGCMLCLTLEQIDWLFHAQMQDSEGRDRQKMWCKRESVWNNAAPKRTPGSFHIKTAAINSMQIMKVMNWLL